MNSHGLVLDKLHSHDAALDKLQSDVAKVQSDLKHVQSDLKHVQSDLKDLQSELRDGLRDVRAEMNERFEAAQRRSDDTFNRLRILIESVQSDVKLMLEHLTRGLTAIARHDRQLDTHEGRLDHLDVQVNALSARRRKPS